MSKEQNYWGATGRFQTKSDMLRTLIPDEGGLQGNENKALEKLRKASNCYYDLFNNGLCNRANEFRKLFGFGGKIIKKNGFNLNSKEAIVLELKMDEIILNAFEEQKLNLPDALEKEKNKCLERLKNILDSIDPVDNKLEDNTIFIETWSRAYNKTKTLQFHYRRIIIKEKESGGS